MQEKDIYRDREGYLYYVEYDENNNPYKVYCDEYGNPINYNNYNSDQEENYTQPTYYEQNDQQNYRQEPVVAPNYTNYEEQPKKKKSKWWLWLFIILLVIGGGGTAAYFGYTKFMNKEATVKLADYEINFVPYGNEGEGQAGADIKAIPIVENVKESDINKIDEVLKNAEATFDKKDGLKNGEKVEVTLKVDTEKLKEYNVKAIGEFKQKFTVAGLTPKPEVKKEESKESSNNNNSNNDNNNNTSKNNSQSQQNISKKDERYRYINIPAGVNLRSEPNDSSRILSTARNGHRVYQYSLRTNSNGEVWAQVEYNGQTGWMRADLLS